MENILLIVAILVIPLIAEIKVKSAYSKYMKTKNTSGLSGTEVARRILDNHNLNSVYVVETPGVLSDHYDPRRKTVRLSYPIFEDTTIASVAVAAHECGHAIQDKIGYVPMRIRSAIVPVVNFGSKIAWIVILIGLFTQYFKIFILGVALISLGLIFQLITLPVEFDASRRAKIELKKLGLVSTEEGSGVAKMLFAAAMTYVAGVLTSILEIVRILLMFNDRRK